MASGPGVPMLVERGDVHKSCKSLETLLNILNDYCEAAGAVVTLQKKLSKALRETAGLKVTGDIAGNALNTSATIFEALSEIDSKFAKYADKEYDGISGEVKKWFKKLAKEEKAHDDKISNANTKIKQAGQAYEKKSKKNPRDAGEEHARYINILSTVGPEMSQEKYNHSLQITQRHTATTNSVAACVSRLADAEWLRACEGVRRFSPTIGPLGEWRSYCEGGWTGSIPQDLPDVDQQDQGDAKRPEDNQSTPATTMRNVGNDPPEQHFSEGRYAWQSERDLSTLGIASGREPYNSATQGPSSNAGLASSSPPPSSFEPPRPLTDPNTGSVRSLSAFPSPPTHFPIPSLPLRQPSVSQSQQSPQSRNVSSSSASASRPSLTTRLTESPLPEKRADLPLDVQATETGAGTSTPQQVLPAPPRLPPSSSGSPHVEGVRSETSSPDLRRPPPQRSQTMEVISESRVPSKTTLPSDSSTQIPSIISRVDNPGQDEFGMTGKSKSGSNNSGPDTVKAPVSANLERSDTGNSGTGSIVAAMRHRYSNSSGTISPSPTKEVPRLPLPFSVTDLATRYQTIDTNVLNSSPSPTSPRIRTASPPAVARQPPNPSSLDKYSTVQERRDVTTGGYRSGPSSPSARPDDNDERERRRQQRMEELADLELKEKAQQLQERELEIELKARDLERDRANFASMSTRGGAISDNDNLPRQRRTSFHPRSQLDLSLNSNTANNVPMNSKIHSYSTTHLIPPPVQSEAHNSSNVSRASSSHTEHSMYCTCEACSASHYNTSSPISASSQDLRRPPEPPIVLRQPEKPKGWMRRFSMPVGMNAFSSSSSQKGIEGGLGKKNVFSLDGKRNSSSTTLMAQGVGVLRAEEDGRMGISAGRRNYQGSGSVTNLSRR